MNVTILEAHYSRLKIYIYIYISCTREGKIASGDLTKHLLHLLKEIREKSRIS